MIHGFDLEKQRLSGSNGAFLRAQPGFKDIR
jgi:hypothetical protein